MKCLKPKLIPALAQRVFEQSATENTHILCYWQTIHNSISKICPVFKFSALTFLRSMSCSMSIELKLCKERNFQLQSMSHAISSIDKRFVAGILVYRVWPWYPTWAILEQRSCTQKTGPRLRKIMSHIPYFSARSMRTDGVVGSASHSESGDVGSISVGYWPWSILCDTKPVSILKRALVYCYALYFFFQVLEFRQWQSRSDRFTL